MEDSTRNDL